MEIVETKERNTVSVRYRTPVAQLSVTMGPIYGEIAAYLGRSGLAMAGAPFAMYYNMDMNDLDVEIGFPVAAPVAGEGRVRPGKLPGGRFATDVHVGPYSTIEATYNRLTAWVAEKGLAMETYMFEEYLNDPEEVPADRVQTRIWFPLKS